VDGGNRGSCTTAVSFLWPSANADTNFVVREKNYFFAEKYSKVVLKNRVVLHLMRARLDNFSSMLSQKLLQLALNHLHCAISVATALVWRAAA
jgi:hypothetical protein